MKQIPLLTKKVCLFRIYHFPNSDLSSFLQWSQGNKPMLPVTLWLITVFHSEDLGPESVILNKKVWVFFPAISPELGPQHITD